MEQAGAHGIWTRSQTHIRTRAHTHEPTQAKLPKLRLPGLLAVAILYPKSLCLKFNITGLLVVKAPKQDARASHSKIVPLRGTQASASILDVPRLLVARPFKPKCSLFPSAKNACYSRKLDVIKNSYKVCSADRALGTSYVGQLCILTFKLYVLLCCAVQCVYTYQHSLVFGRCIWPFTIRRLVWICVAMISIVLYCLALQCIKFQRFCIVVYRLALHVIVLCRRASHNAAA